MQRESGREWSVEPQMGHRGRESRKILRATGVGRTGARQHLVVRQDPWAHEHPAVVLV